MSSRTDHDEALRLKLEQWAADGLLSTEQAAAILDHERAAESSPGRIPLASEAVGYIGGALILAAVALVVGRRWDEFDAPARIAVLAIPTLLLTFAGWWAGSSDEPALVRLGSLLWFLSCAGLAGTLTVVFVDAMYDGDPPEHGGLLLVAGGVAVWSGVEWWMRKLPLQHAAFFIASMLAVCGVVNGLEGIRDTDYSPIAWGAAVWIFGLVWTGLGIGNRLTPTVLARVLGSAAMLAAAQLVAADARVAGLWLGLATTALLIGIGVNKSVVPELLVGTAGAFQWSPQFAIYYLADAFGAEVALFAVGALLLGAAALLARTYRRVLSAERATLR